jgi:hypothetical protein
LLRVKFLLGLNLIFLSSCCSSCGGYSDLTLELSSGWGIKLWLEYNYMIFRNQEKCTVGF